MEAEASALKFAVRLIVSMILAPVGVTGSS
jgi:hypothetical protein